MQVKRYAELVSATGTELGYTDWVELPQEVVSAFADVTGDHQWIHVDADAAARGPFGTTIVHGFLLLSLLPTFSEDWFAIEDSPMSINYGFDKIRFTSVVPAGSRVRGHGEIVALEDRGSAVHATIRVQVLAEGSDRPACVADWIYRSLAPLATAEVPA
ncbi:MAG: dehydratase [Streptosporangiales bacterium]|nr:dehydratase [Streptosporangiales bacterium]